MASARDCEMWGIKDAFRWSAISLVAPVSALVYALLTWPSGSAATPLATCIYGRCPDPAVANIVTEPPTTFNLRNLLLVLVAVRILQWALTAMASEGGVGH